MFNVVIGKMYRLFVHSCLLQVPAFNVHVVKFKIDTNIIQNSLQSFRISEKGYMGHLFSFYNMQC